MDLPRILEFVENGGKWRKREKKKERNRKINERRLVVRHTRGGEKQVEKRTFEKMLSLFPNSFQSESTSTVSLLTKIPHQRVEREWKSIKRKRERDEEKKKILKQPVLIFTFTFLDTFFFFPPSIHAYTFFFFFFYFPRTKALLIRALASLFTILLFFAHLICSPLFLSPPLPSLRVGTPRKICQHVYKKRHALNNPRLYSTVLFIFFFFSSPPPPPPSNYEPAKPPKNLFGNGHTAALTSTRRLNVRNLASLNSPVTLP